MVHKTGADCIQAIRQQDLASVAVLEAPARIDDLAQIPFAQIHHIQRLDIVKHVAHDLQGAGIPVLVSRNLRQVLTLAEHAIHGGHRRSVHPRHINRGQGTTVSIHIRHVRHAGGVYSAHIHAGKLGAAREQAAHGIPLELHTVIDFDSRDRFVVPEDSRRIQHRGIGHAIHGVGGSHHHSGLGAGVFGQDQHTVFSIQGILKTLRGRCIHIANDTACCLFDSLVVFGDDLDRHGKRNASRLGQVRINVKGQAHNIFARNRNNAAFAQIQQSDAMLIFVVGDCIGQDIRILDKGSILRQGHLSGFQAGDVHLETGNTWIFSVVSSQGNLHHSLTANGGRFGFDGHGDAGVICRVSHHGQAGHQHRQRQNQRNYFFMFHSRHLLIFH